MKNIFIALTPYHAFLSFGIAMQECSGDKNFLIVINDFGNPDGLIKPLKSWERSPFAEVRCLPGMYGAKGVFMKRWRVRNNIQLIREEIKKERVRRVYVFNERRAEVQAVLHYAKKENKDAVCIYGEDGVGAYSSYGVKQKTAFRFLLGKLFYGFWWEMVDVFGVSRRIDEVRAIFPEFIREDLKRKCVSGISRDAVLEMRKINWPLGSFSSRGSIDIEFNKLDAVLVVAHSEFWKRIPDYRQTMEKVLEIGKELGMRFAVKYHPRERLEDYLFVDDADNLCILPSALPIELFYIIKDEKIKCVIGERSTALLTAKWLLKNSAVFSLTPFEKRPNPGLMATFQKVGIEVLQDLSALRKSLSACNSDMVEVE